MHPLLLPSKFFFFITLISFFLIFFPKSVLANSFLSCSSRFSCGNLKDIGYPFCGGDRPASCGYPGFELSCTENVLEITINSATYKVLDLDSPLHTLRVARTDYSDNICPTHLINSTFEKEPFQINDETRDIRVYYDCPENLTSIPQIYNKFDCTINNTEMVGYYVTRETGTGNSLEYSCNNSVIIPVPISEVGSLEDNMSSDALEEALRAGFQLRWSANDSSCDSCIKNSGQCGHNINSGEFMCYKCPDGEDCTIRSKGGIHNHKARYIGLGVGIAGAAVLLVGIGIGILLVRKQRRKKFSAQVISRELPTSPSSKGQTTSTTNTSQTNSSYYTSTYDDIERGSTYFGVHVFNYEELEEATHNFNPSKQLGQGGFGTVYHGVLKDGRVVAVKRLYENNLKRVDQYMNEIEILTLLRHPNLVTLYGCTSRRSRELLLVYEYIPNGTVADHLHGKGSNSCLLTWNVRLSIALETATALTYLHKKDIIHRDIKSNNILLDKNFHVKVADFGLSRLFPTDVTHVSTAPQGTPGYVDPEYHQCYHLTEKSDVYSFGVVLVELVSAKKAVDISRHRHDINLANMAISRIQNQALHELVDPSLGFEHDCEVKNSVTAVAALAFRCVQQERELRPSMEEVLETLREIKGVRTEAEVVDIRSDDVGLLKNIPPPISPDYGTDKWVQIRSM